MQVPCVELDCWQTHAIVKSDSDCELLQGRMMKGALLPRRLEMISRNRTTITKMMWHQWCRGWIFCCVDWCHFSVITHKQEQLGSISCLLLHKDTGKKLMRCWFCHFHPSLSQRCSFNLCIVIHYWLTDWFSHRFLELKPLASFISRRRSLMNKHVSSSGSSASKICHQNKVAEEETNDKITFAHSLPG